MDGGYMMTAYDVFMCVCAELEAVVCRCSLKQIHFLVPSEGHYHQGNYIHVAGSNQCDGAQGGDA